MRMWLLQNPQGLLPKSIRNDRPHNCSNNQKGNSETCLRAAIYTREPFVPVVILLEVLESVVDGEGNVGQLGKSEEEESIVM